jgi:hypothetical protein
LQTKHLNISTLSNRTRKEIFKSQNVSCTTAEPKGGVEGAYSKVICGTFLLMKLCRDAGKL